MKLSRVERWILYNQCRILAALYPKEAKYYEEACTAFERGYEFHYSDYCPVYPDDEIMDRTECLEVLDILEMHRRLKWSYEALTDDEKKGIDPLDIEFCGFDGNEEARYLMYAEWFCKLDGGRYKELHKPDGFNSHAPTLYRYRAMLNEWRPLREKQKLSRDDILRIIQAPRTQR